MENETSYHIKIILEYNKLSKENDSQKISFYKNNESFFDQIPLNKKLNIVQDFLKSLFHRAEYEEYLNRCDAIIEALFDSKLFPSFDRELVIDLLYLKASSEFYVHDSHRSMETLIGLVSLDRQNSLRYKDLLYRIFKSKRLLLKYQARGLVIAFVLTSAILSIWTAVFVQSTQPESVGTFQKWTIVTFLTGILIWVAFKGYNNYRSWKEAVDFIDRHKKGGSKEQF